MKFEIIHRFDAPPEAVWEALLHPRLAEILVAEMADLLEMEALEIAAEGARIRRRVRYRPTPIIKKVGPKAVEPRWLEWIEQSVADPAARRVDFENVPRVPQVAQLLANKGRIELRPEGGGTRRVTAGELKVKVLLLGRIAEKMIYKQAQALLDQEAAVTARVLAAGGVDAWLDGRAGAA